ncbi:hypothetical protein [Aquimarina longa]|uniref:hypothetical protein n=1 Tax=Aquimarina longa TaxID=1080221 RepID=UPI0011E02BDC|nr:hypothetical protein [Aquimarina longa]
MRYKLNIITFSVLSCIGSIGLNAQDKQNKLSEKLMVNNDVTLTLNTSHTNIIFETWNKNTIAVEAYLEGNLSEENNKRILDSWQVNVLGDQQNVTINSSAGNLWGKNEANSTIALNRRSLQELKMLEPMIVSMLEPIMKNMAKNPMPNALTENHSNVNYNNGSYKEDKKYVQQWESQIREKFKEDAALEKQKWIKQFENTNSEQLSPGQMKVRLEAWGEQYDRQMQAWASQLIKDVGNQQPGITNITVYRRYNTTNKINADNISKTIKIRIPKRANLRLNIRHGNIQLAEIANNIKASLSHTTLSANIIDGDQTYIKSSYSPVSVRQWNNGRLVVNYVKNCRIQKAKNLLVNADSSNVFIQELNDNGAISGSFGVITIANLGESFSTLDLAIQNSDFKLKLPKASFNLSYNGAQSVISLPETLDINTRNNFGNVVVNGFQNTRSTDKMITINAKYSKVVLNNNK